MLARALAEFAAFVQAKIARWARLVRYSGAKPECALQNQVQ